MKIAPSLLSFIVQEVVGKKEGSSRKPASRQNWSFKLHIIRNHCQTVEKPSRNLTETDRSIVITMFLNSLVAGGNSTRLASGAIARVASRYNCHRYTIT